MITRRHRLDLRWSLVVMMAGGVGLLLLSGTLRPTGAAPLVEMGLPPAVAVAGEELAAEPVTSLVPSARVPALVVPVTQEPPPEASAWPRALRTERDWQRHFLALARNDRAACDAALAAAFAEPRPLAARVAALRVSYELGGPGRFAHLGAALSEPAREHDLRAFAVHFLAGRCAADAEARVQLQSFLRGAPDDVTLRGAATYSVLRWGTPVEIRAILGGLSEERDVGVMARAAMALKERDERAADPMLDELLRQNSSPDVRHRLQEELTGRYCPEHAPRPEGGR